MDFKHFRGLGMPRARDRKGKQSITALLSVSLVAWGTSIAVLNAAETRQVSPGKMGSLAIKISQTCEERSSRGGKEIITKTERTTYKGREITVKTVEDKPSLFINEQQIEVVLDEASGRYATSSLPNSDYATLWDMAKDLIDNGLPSMSQGQPN